MNCKNKPTIWIWRETENPFGRALGFIFALVGIFDGLMMLWLPFSYLGSTTPLCLIFFASLKLFGICALIYGLGTLRDLWRTRH